MDGVSLGTAFLNFLHLNVDRNGDVGDSTGGQGRADSEIGDALHVGAAHDSLVIDRDIDEELVQRDVLLCKGTDKVAMLQAGDREDRCMVHLRVVETIQKMNATWAGGCDTNAQLAGELRIGAGHKGGSLFMPHVNEPYPFLLLAKGLEDPVDPIARQTEYGVNAPGEQTFYKYVRCVTHD